jgi:hypothetical protein
VGYIPAPVPPRVRTLALSAGALAIGLGGCGGVDDGKLEDQISERVEKEGGQVSSVDCPSDEKIEKGNTFTCTLRTVKGASVPIRVSITSEDDGGRAEYVIPPDVLAGET